MSFSFKKVIVLADEIPDEIKLDTSCQLFERPRSTYVHDLIAAVKQWGIEVIHVHNPKELAQFIDRPVLVLSIWSGEKTKFRKALPASTCESLGISYLGADPYVQMLCQNKSLTKQYVREFGIEAADEFLVSPSDENVLYPVIDLPYVVKPNFEGGSIGIDKSCLLDNHEQAIHKAVDMAKFYSQSILVESFLPGIEVCVVVVGNEGEIKFFEAVEIYLEEDPEFFHNNIYSVELKKQRGTDTKVNRRLVTDLLSENDKQNIINLFNSFDKCDFMRIDGKIHNNSFKLLELTPDPNLSLTGSFSAAFSCKNYTYEQMVGAILGLDYIN